MEGEAEVFTFRLWQIDCILRESPGVRENWRHEAVLVETFENLIRVKPKIAEVNRLRDNVE